MASNSITCRESQFYRQLDSVGKRRYREKLDMLHLDMDPYLTTPDVWIGSPESWPDVTYLLFSPSPCTKDDLKGLQEHRSLEICHFWLCKQDQIAENKCRFMFGYSQGTCIIHMKLKSLISHLLHHPCRSSIARK